MPTKTARHLITVDPSGALLCPRASGYSRPTTVAAAASRGTASHTPSAGLRLCTCNRFRASTKAVPGGGGGRRGKSVRDNINLSLLASLVQGSSVRCTVHKTIDDRNILSMIKRHDI